MFGEVLTCFGASEEPRQSGKTEHRSIDILSITVCAVLTHAESFEDIALYGRLKEKWLRRFLDLTNGIPSHNTFRRVFMRIDAARFEDCFLAWTRAVFTPPKPGKLHQIAVDGKAMRRSFDRRKGHAAPHVVSAFATQSGLTLAQRVVAAKSGEAEVLSRLPDGLDLAGALISLDAPYARKTIAGEIVGKNADFLIALKGNNKNDHALGVDPFAETALSRTSQTQTHPVFDAFEETPGRLTRRRAFVTDDPDLLGALDGWPGLRQVIAVETITSVNQVHGGGPGKTTFDIRYFPTSSKLGGPALAAAVRDHRAIENSLHWVLDLGFREEECRIRHRNAAANLAVIRKIAINLVKADTSQNGSIKGKRNAAGWDNDFMRKIIDL